MMSKSTFLCVPEASIYGCGGKPCSRVVAPWRCGLMSASINGLYGNIQERVVAAPSSYVLLMVETKVSSKRQVSKLLVPGFA